MSTVVPAPTVSLLATPAGRLALMAHIEDNGPMYFADLARPLTRVVGPMLQAAFGTKFSLMAWVLGSCDGKESFVESLLTSEVGNVTEVKQRLSYLSGVNLTACRHMAVDGDTNMKTIDIAFGTDEEGLNDFVAAARRYAGGVSQFLCSEAAKSYDGKIVMIELKTISVHINAAVETVSRHQVTRSRSEIRFSEKQMHVMRESQLPVYLGAAIGCARSRSYGWRVLALKPAMVRSLIEHTTTRRLNLLGYMYGSGVAPDDAEIVCDQFGQSLVMRGAEDLAHFTLR